MAYRLSIADDVASGVRACAREQLEGAIERLEHPGEDRAEAIHEARKHLKKARALLRLVRPALGAKAFRRESDALRDAGRALSQARDADVLVATIDRLAAHAAGRLPAADFAQLREALAAQASGEALADSAPVAEALREALARVEAWPLEGAGWGAAIAGAGRAYARGRDALAAARADPTVEALHEWRKRVKDLWYHERLLAPAWAEVIGAHGEQAHVLSELLGDDHDLAVLRGRLERGIELPPGAAADLAPLLALVDERRAQLHAQALALGDLLYAEPPKAFARRLERYLRAALAREREGSAAA